MGIPRRLRGAATLKTVLPMGRPSFFSSLKAPHGNELRLPFPGHDPARILRGSCPGFARDEAGPEPRPRVLLYEI